MAFDNFGRWVPDNFLSTGTTRGFISSGSSNFSTQHASIDKMKIKKDTKFYDNDKKAYECFYKDGLTHGNQQWWHYNGKLMESISWSMGNKHGRHIRYYENGQRIVKLEFRNNQMHGIQKEYHLGGGLKKIQYFLYGIEVTQKFFKTLPENIDVKKEIENKNTQYRAMIFQHVGYDKILHQLKGKVFSEWEDYQLIKIKEIDIEDVILLKMNCPSTGAWYCERVPYWVTSCEMALSWREYEIEKAEDFKEYIKPETRK